MKKAAIFAMAAALMVSLAACGNRDNGGQDVNNSGTSGSGQTANGGVNGTVGGGVNSDNNGDNNGSLPGSVGNGSLTGDNGTGTPEDNGGTAGRNGRASVGNGRSSVGNDLRRAADGVGDAARNAVDGVGNAARNAVDDVTRSTASTTSFQRMLENARVHDTDGVLTDGENSRW